MLFLKYRKTPCNGLLIQVGRLLRLLLLVVICLILSLNVISLIIRYLALIYEGQHGAQQLHKGVGGRHLFISHLVPTCRRRGVASCELLLGGQHQRARCRPSTGADCIPNSNNLNQEKVHFNNENRADIHSPLDNCP